MRYLSWFGRFWWEFLVGETPEVTLGIAAVIGLAAGLSHLGRSAVAAVPLGVVAVLVLSVRRARGRGREAVPPPPEGGLS